MNGPMIYFTIPILGGIPITQTTVSSFLVMVILCVTGGILGRHLQKRPSGRQVLTEKLITTLYDMVGDTMGRHNLYWAPYIGTLFLSSALGSLIGMTGFLRSATSDLSTTLTWALMTSVLVWVCSIRANGVWGWLKGYAEPVAVMLPMNIVSEIAQAKQKRDEIVREAAELAHRQERDILNAAREEAKAITAKAHSDIRQERRKVFNEMKTEISDIAIEIAEKVTEKEIDSDKHRELIDSFIDQIGEAS